MIVYRCIHFYKKIIFKKKIRLLLYFCHDVIDSEKILH